MIGAKNSSENLLPRRAIVLGAGVVGVATAYALARRGVPVTIIDRADIELIIAVRNTPAESINDPRDADEDGMITVLDARGPLLPPPPEALGLAPSAPPVAAAVALASADAAAVPPRG